MKLLISGGHISPALALVDSLKNLDKKVEVVFIGRKYTQDKDLSLEYKEITRRKIKFINLTAGRVTRTINMRTILNISKIPLGFFNGYKIISSQKPDVFLSFGGYIAVPLAFFCWLKNIPIFTHEQTISPGVANRIIAVFAKKIFISFKESSSYFDKQRTVLTGNPLRKEFKKVTQLPLRFGNSLPVIYVTGGSLGSHNINQIIFANISKLLSFANVIHQVGNIKEFSDFKKAVDLKKSLENKTLGNYEIFDHIPSDKIESIYGSADMVIGRSGANTIFELISLKKPSLLIPLPWSAGKEQLQHAELLQKAATAEIFHEGKTKEEFIEKTKKVLNNLEIYRRNFFKLEKYNIKDAEKAIINEIIK